MLDWHVEVGLCVGVVEGDLLGLCVGVVEGDLLGLCVGVEDVGLEVGLKVGNVGLKVGLDVGLEVGGPVGARVPSVGVGNATQYMKRGPPTKRVKIPNAASACRHAAPFDVHCLSPVFFSY